MCSIYMYLEERASFVHSILVLIMVIQNHLKLNLTRTGKKSMENKVFFTNLFHRVPKETAKKMDFLKSRSNVRLPPYPAPRSGSHTIEDL